MSDEEPQDIDPAPGSDDAGEGERLRHAIDALAGDGSEPTRPRSAQAEELTEQARQAIEAELGDVAYVQHEYGTRAHDVCRVGVRRDDRIEETIVAVGGGGVARYEEIADQVDELRRGRSLDELDRLLT